MDSKKTSEAKNGDGEIAAPESDVRRVVLNPRSGEVNVATGAYPGLDDGSVLIQTAFSVISPGTERSKLELASNSLLGKARSRPDLVRKVVDKARTEGWRATTAAVKRQLQEPMTLGYSLSGTVLVVGSRVRDIRPGDRVAAGGGGYAIHADVVAVPQNLVVRVPDGVPLDQAAMTTIACVGMHGFRLADVQVGGTVVVIGLGLVGLLAAGVARAAGCRVIGADLNKDMIQRAIEAGINSVDSSTLEDEVHRTTKGRGADAVLICAASKSAEPIALAGRVARDRARIVVIGNVPANAPRALYYEKELELVLSRSYGPGRYDPSFEEHGHDYPIGYVRWTEQRNMESFLDLLDDGLLDIAPLVRDRFSLREAVDAYEKVKNKPGSIALLDFDTPGVPATSVPRATASRSTTLKPAGCRVGLIGTGSFASRVLVPAIKKAGATVSAVVSKQGRRPAWATEGGAELLPSAEDMLAREDIDAVFIASRHDSHASLTIAALESGKPVFVEKPLALNREELEGVVAAYSAAGLPAQVGFNRRFAPLTIKLTSLLSARSGPAFITIRVNPGPLPVDHWFRDPDIGGGRILGEMCHFVDLGAFLVGAEPSRVMAGSSRSPVDSPQTSEDVSATFEFRDGSCVEIAYVASGDPALGKERIETSFDGKSFVIDNWTQFISAVGGQVKKSKHAQDKGHESEVASFVSLLGGNGSDHFATSVSSMRATMAVIESLSLGTSVDL